MEGSETSTLKRAYPYTDEVLIKKPSQKVKTVSTQEVSALITSKDNPLALEGSSKVSESDILVNVSKMPDNSSPSTSKVKPHSLSDGKPPQNNLCSTCGKNKPTPNLSNESEASKPGGFMTDSVKKYPRIQLEKQELMEARAQADKNSLCRKVIDEEGCEEKLNTHVKLSKSFGSSFLQTPNNPNDSSVGLHSSSPRSSRSSCSLQHLTPLYDQLDVCECGRHCRRSLSVCRASKRKTSPLKLVKEIEKEEESLQDINEILEDKNIGSIEEESRTQKENILIGLERP